MQENACVSTRSTNVWHAPSRNDPKPTRGHDLCFGIYAPTHLYFFSQYYGIPEFFLCFHSRIRRKFPPSRFEQRKTFPPLIFLIEQEIIFDCKRILYNVVSVYRKGSIFRSCFLKQSDSKHPLLPPI